MKSNKHLNPFPEFEEENSGREEKHLKGLSPEEKRMIKLMASIFVKSVFNNTEKMGNISTKMDKE